GGTDATWRREPARDRDPRRQQLESRRGRVSEDQQPSGPRVEQSPGTGPRIDVGGAGMDIELPSSLAILPSRDAVLYPGMLLPFQVGDPQWVRLLSDAVSAREPVGLFLQRDAATNVTRLEELHAVGTAANIVRLLKLPDGSL